FLVTPDLVMTTRHAAETFATGVGTRDLAFRPGCEPWIDFGSGADAAIQGNLFPVASVVMIHPHLDVALLRLSAPAVAPPLALWSVDPGTLEGHEVAVIGYPQFDIRYSMQVQKQIFGNDPCTKRVMPGRVTPPRLVTSFGRQVFALTHDCITLGGRSGAPVLHISSGRVVGVSFASVYLDANFAVPISELSRDPRFWDLGLTFEDAARPATSPYQDEWDTADPADAMPAAAATVFVSATPAASLRSVVDQLVSDHFSDPHKFREFLAANNHHDVVRAVPSGADSKELVRALDRRGLIDEEFLYELAHAVPDAPRTSTRGQLSRWLPQSMLSRAMWAAESIDAHAMELYTLGSPWRDYVLGEDGVPEAASATIERLAYDTRPEIQHVLGWLLRRLYESLPAEPERVEALYEALQHIEGGQPHGGPQVAAPVAAPTEPPAMHSIDYLREGLEASRSVGLIELPATSGAVAAGSSAWLLTPSLVVVPAHVILTKGTSPQARLEADHGAERAKGAKFTLDFDSDRKHANEHAVESVALLDLYLDLAILRLRSPIHDRLPLRVRAEAVTDNLTSLTIVHHPRLGPKQISRDGRILRTGGSDVIYMLDTAPGSAGAPVFDDQWRVIAIHRAFVNYRSAPDVPSVRAKLGTAAASMLSRLHDRENHHALWREVVAAQPALKSVNVNPSTDLADTDKVPIAMQLLDDVRIGDVEGFHLTSQLGDVATGFCSREGLKALVDHPKVLSIELSKPAGSIECAMSVPHVRANIVHNAPLGELGDKALVAIIDSGIDVCHRAFCDEQGRTRIVAFWDQRDARSPAADTTK
ncbi:MAG TPA: trypsin-like peptidase domain-containing protein, partial [Vicinamibacterales bacterium]|nr:trypsin-like peptidase domain-containing protein [Vicinamibacterales bacterium]